MFADKHGRECDEHAHCPFCNDQLVRDNRGMLVCHACGTDALDAAVVPAELEQAAL